jgi:hypothetical protein
VTEQQLARMAKRRLAILRHAEEITGNVSLAANRAREEERCSDGRGRRPRHARAVRAERTKNEGL